MMNVHAILLTLINKHSIAKGHQDHFYEDLFENHLYKHSDLGLILVNYLILASLHLQIK